MNSMRAAEPPAAATPEAAAVSVSNEYAQIDCYCCNSISLHCSCLHCQHQQSISLAAELMQQTSPAIALVGTSWR